MIQINRTITFLLVLVMVVSCNTPSEKKQETAQKLLANIADKELSGVKQTLVVFNSQTNNHQATLFAFEKTLQGWDQVFDEIPAGIGKNGFAPTGEKVEGDGKSPSGIFALGNLFTYLDSVDTQMPFQTTTADDKWIDDPESESYNCFVQGETDAKSYENLLLKSDAYKFCMVIEYNTKPVVKGKGSAIFFHLNKTGNESTAGCVAITEENMLRVLKWLNPESNPHIIMGNSNEILSEFNP
ncbi:L,D-transpeptidase family protein [Draconibacterium sp. IB214405]|uniref:L,D-transpeptidase family protein n=1 Tax=Draconibacterium sp. IB214405 TaxID=3097352 RepID=UPI002A1177AA|nr:L,D-transpeptidase family protein [Draconibacterium sp. IB214405]MDX8341410.1 L,D-transpeptidase family protein [Draconibacterium sp. IB214405]